MPPLQLILKFREQYPVPVREEFDQLVASLNAQVPASINSAISAIAPSVAAGPGVWIPIPFVATDFTGNGAMTWTVVAGGGGAALWQYMIMNHTCWVMFDITGTVAGTPNTQLLLKAPVPTLIGFPAQPVWIINPGPSGSIGVLAPGNPNILIYKDPTTTTNWLAGTARVSGIGMYLI